PLPLVGGAGVGVGASREAAVPRWTPPPQPSPTRGEGAVTASPETPCHNERAHTMTVISHNGIDVPATSVSRGALWTGRVMSGLVIAFLLFDGAMKLIPLQVVIDTSQQMAIPHDIIRTLGTLTIIATLLYAWPRTSVLGAILLTGYLGGAIYAHYRLADP